jgi:hypothetical protein
MSQPITWERRSEAYKAIHDAVLSGIAQAPIGKHVTKFEFTYSGGSVSTLIAKQDAEVLFTLVFVFNEDGSIQSITRS